MAHMHNRGNRKIDRIKQSMIGNYGRDIVKKGYELGGDSIGIMMRKRRRKGRKKER